MNDFRRVFLWVIFAMSLVMLWDKWQIYNGHSPLFFPAPPSVVSQAASGPKAATGGPDLPAPASAALSATAPTSPAAPAAQAAAHERVEFSTDVLKLSFDTEGGSLVRTELLQHRDLVDKSHDMVLLDDSKDQYYVAQSGLLAGADGAAALPTHKTVMALMPGERSLKEGTNELVVRFESPELGGVKLIKTYTFKRGEYSAQVRHEVVNHSGAAVSPQLYLQLVRDGNKPPGASSFYSTFTGPAVYTSAKKYEKVEFANIKKNKVDIQTEASDGYIAMVQHYFFSAWILPDGIKRRLEMRALDLGSGVSDCCYRVAMVAPLEAIAPGATKAVDAVLYAGPQEEKKLEVLAPGLELVKDYGYFKILSEPLYWLLYKLHGFIQNWGWSIVALVLLLKLVFFWLNAKAFASMAKMKAVAPRITEMRERLKDKPQQMQQEMMRIYREEKINPLGGCLPIMIQIPVFIALYWVLLSSVEMRNAPWALWITDLSVRDPIFVLPTIMMLTTLVQTALNPPPADPMQAKMMWIMPLAFGVMFYFFPSGLVLYYITNNLLTILQQGLINKRMGVPMKLTLPKF